MPAGPVRQILSTPAATNCLQHIRVAPAACEGNQHNRTHVSQPRVRVWDRMPRADAVAGNVDGGQESLGFVQPPGNGDKAQANITC